MAAVGLVSSTTASKFSHMVKTMIQKRESFSTQTLIYTDTWPNNNAFWQLLVPGIQGHLGLFHLIKRVVDTMDSKCTAYWQALTDFKAAVYRYHDKDEEGLLSHLRKEMSDKKIGEWRNSKK